MAKNAPKVEMWPIDKIIPYEQNAKIHTEVQIESLAKVIRSQGWDVPIVVDRHGIIIKGHGRRLAAIHMGLKEVPVICRSDLTPAQVKAARLSDNRVALTDFDANLIKNELTALSQESFDMGSIGFDQHELDMMLKALDEVNTEVFENETSPGSAPTENEDKNHKTAKSDLVDLATILGFKLIPNTAERDLAKFMSYAESMTGKRGGDAFAEFCASVVTEIEARAQ